MEWKKEINGVLQLKHRFHTHPLVLVDEKESNQSEKAYCSGCAKLVSGPCFSCAECKYHLHQKCAEAPDQIDNHPLHRDHDYGFYLQERPMPDKWYACALCKEKGDMFFYECPYCFFCLDITCALFLDKVGENFYQSVDNAHRYPFMFIENHKDKLKKVSCSWCHQPLVDSIYVSIDYKFYLHERCFKLPTQIDHHPLHRTHTLFLEFDVKNPFCKLCQKEDKEHFFYHCFACNSDTNLECIWRRHVIEDKRYHEHPFTLLWKRHSFICDACGTNGNFVSYICSTCNLQVHEKCASLPRTIKITRHDHPLIHKFFFEKNELEKHDCEICFEELKTECGSYHCLKKDCNCVVHVECAVGDSSLYEIVDQENPENLAEDMESSISVVEVNEHGEATKIKHFLHDDQHELQLEDKIIKKEGDNRCSGCVLSITTPFYYCLKCDFVLHKACAELPKKKHHWYHLFLATLGSFDNPSVCDFCGHWCNKFYSGMSSRGSWLRFCLRCARVPHIIKHEGHKHKLFFDYKCKGQCNGCGGSSEKGAFRCKYCSFTLDFACVALPLAIQHKCDEHLLQLTYDEEERDDREQRYCDICETKRDPNRWYYHCASCENSAHPICVLGKYPFLRIGDTVEYRRHHRHPLRFARRVYEYRKCHSCGEHCDDVFFECAPCNYFLHLECRWGDP